MQKIFKMLGSLVERKPFKSLLLTLLMVAAMIAGASQMRMATGNETLVQVDNPVYMSNQAMETSFGGDTILILFEASDSSDLLSVDTIRKMYELEQRLLDENLIFSVMSPASLTHQITIKQSEMIIKSVDEMSQGLYTMGKKMVELGTSLLAKNIKDPQDMMKKLDELSAMSEKFTQLASGQTQMGLGIIQLESGLYQVSDGLSTLATQLTGLAQSQSTGALQTNLLMMASNLEATSVNLQTMGANTQGLKTGTQSTANALTTIETNLSQELNGMKAGFEDAISPDELKTMAEGFLSMGESLTLISGGLETFYIKSSMMKPTIPSLQEELDLILYEEGSLRSAYSDVILNDQQAMMMVKLEGNLDDPEKERLTQLVIKQIEEAEFNNITSTISGKTVLDMALRAEMQTSMMMMVALAILIMFAVLLLVFKVKWRMLSLGVIFVSVVATLGFMSWIKVPVTMVSMAVFPILIGLGIDYSIQMHNRFHEEQNVRVTLEQMGKPVAIAVFATVLGFISLYASPVPMIQDFGKMLTIGVMVSFLAAIFILMPIIQIGKLNDHTKQKKKAYNDENSRLNRVLSKLTQLTLKLSLPILIITFAVAGYGFYVDRLVGVETDIETFMPQDLPALLDIHKIREALEATDQIVLYVKDENVLSEFNLAWLNSQVDLFETQFNDEIVSTKSVTSLLSTLGVAEDALYIEKISALEDLPKTQRSMFLKEDHTEMIVLINTKHLSTEASERLLNQMNQTLEDAPMEVQLTGKTVMDVAMVEGLTSGRVTMTLLGLGLVFMALLLIYRSLIKAIIPIIPVMIIIGISSLVMVEMDIAFTPLTATLGALVLGMGSEMTIMVMERYLEERNLGIEKDQAMMIAIQKIGVAVLASGLTTIGGFAVLLFSDFVILQDFGWMTVINISLALMSTFIVLPPLIVLMDRFLIKTPKMGKTTLKVLESEA